MIETADIIFLSLAATALLVAVWLVKHGNTLQEAIARWWRGMNDKAAYLPAFIIALAVLAVWCDGVGWL